jgi:hypothetical protein
MIAEYYPDVQRVKLLDDNGALIGLLEDITKIEQPENGLWQCWHDKRVSAYVWCDKIEEI